MRHVKFELFSLLAVVLAGTFFALADAWAHDPDGHTYAIVDGDLETFRSDFNAASDHVRAVLLVGPT